ncbi:Hypothetical protein SLIV_36413 [Streptomyces lividans TK24]|uniref:AraC family transcriptional regulator n=1 Tax=Streptomyces lividans TK24 TaxID=457428 RepID=A0ABX6TRR7_STRLI|nr:Hypothetical protein SLIV_36413 [Streptomyces lividans TK24]QSJ13776.1 Hypothetical protein SLIVDG2_36413 [Streptomyces lividans]QTD74686.1 Hypothetical protein SLIVYQS_36413 [Streptomyces lividans TK24] [Streptomyces lividans]
MAAQVPLFPVRFTDEWLPDGEAEGTRSPTWHMHRS